MENTNFTNSKMHSSNKNMGNKFPVKKFPKKNITFNNNPHFLIDYLFIQINFLSTKKNKCANFMYNHDGVYIHGIIKELICDPK